MDGDDARQGLRDYRLALVDLQLDKRGLEGSVMSSKSDRTSLMSPKMSVHR